MPGPLALQFSMWSSSLTSNPRDWLLRSSRRLVKRSNFGGWKGGSGFVCLGSRTCRISLQFCNNVERSFWTATTEKSQGKEKEHEEQRRQQQQQPRFSGKEESNSNLDPTSKFNRNRTTSQPLRQHQKHRQQHSEHLNREIPLEYLARLNALGSQLSKLPGLPLLWDNSPVSSAVLEDPRRQSIFEETLHILTEFKYDVERDWIQPSGRHISETSQLLQAALRNLSVSWNASSDVSAYEECVKIMNWMKTWKINLQHSHCEKIMLAAAREGLWKEAAELFSSRIDPGDGRGGSGGYSSPIPISVRFPIGLYCIARYAQKDGRSAVESVFQGVLHMSMLSPSDQTKYILAAGTALGYAGEAEFLRQFVRTNWNDRTLRQPLTAAAMQACLLCNRPDDALQLFDDLTGGEHHASVVWQWEGGGGNLLPVSRDLAIRALGACGQINTSNESYSYFRKILEEDWTMSWQAYLGMLASFEKDLEWAKAVEVLFMVLKRQMENRFWLKEGLSMDIVDANNSRMEAANSESTLHVSSQWAILISALELTMRTCNSSGQFGVALACVHRFSFLYDNFYADDKFTSDEEMHSAGNLTTSPSPEFSTTPFVRTLTLIAERSSNLDDFVGTCIVSLCGANCYGAAKELYTAFQDLEALSIDAKHLGGYVNSPNASGCDFSEMWERINQDGRYLMAIKQGRSQVLSKDNYITISFACSRMLRRCFVAGSPSVGLVLLSWLLDDTSPPDRSLRSIADSLFIKIKSGKTMVTLSDSLLSAMMESISGIGCPNESIELFKRATESKKHTWILSSTEAIKALFDSGRKEEALLLFERLLTDNRKTPGLFLAVAVKLSEQNDYKGVIDVYKRALLSGCLSESLGLLAMGSVSRSTGSDKILMYKDIAKHSNWLTGDRSESSWVKKHYWDLRRRLGPVDVAQILNMHHPKTVQLNEIELALVVLQEERQKSCTSVMDRNYNARLFGSLEAISVAMWNLDRYSDHFGFPMVPHSREDWTATIRETLLLAENTHIYHRGTFMSGMAMGLLKLECWNEFLDLVTSCLSQGVSLQKVIMDEAVRISQNDPSIVETVVAFKKEKE